MKRQPMIDPILSILNSNALTLEDPECHDFAEHMIQTIELGLADEEQQLDEDNSADGEPGGAAVKRVALINPVLARDMIRVEVIAQMIARFAEHSPMGEKHPAITNPLSLIVDRVAAITKEMRNKEAL